MSRRESASADLQEEVEGLLREARKYVRHSLTCNENADGCICGAGTMIRRIDAFLARRLSNPAPTRETVLRAAAKVYMGCVHALSEFVPGEKITYFEASPTKNEECCNRWLALNEAGKVLKAAIEASATPPPPAGSREAAPEDAGPTVTVSAPWLRAILDEAGYGPVLAVDEALTGSDKP